MKKNDTQTAYDILKNYNGKNNQILYYKINVIQRGLPLEEFGVQYILNNYDYEEKELNKIVKISNELGEKLQKKYEIDFVPEKLRITRIIGEMGGSYHCYAQYRSSLPPILIYVNKNHILNDIEVIDYEKIDVDFSKYEKKRKLKEHQKTGVKFLVGSKHCILADSMGLGKSTVAVVGALETNAKRILVLCPATLKSNWKTEICYYDTEDNIEIVSGKEWTEKKKWTIVNYDILQNFYTLPLVPVFEKVKVTNEDGSVTEKTVPVMVKSKTTGKMVQKMKKSINKDIIANALKESKLFTEKFDCVIIDEAHKLSNNSSIRYKILDDFLKRSDIPYIFMLTGTPMVNKPINLYYVLKLIDANVTKDYNYFIKRYCEAKTFKLKTGKEITTTNGAANLEELKEKLKNLYLRREISDMSDMVSKKVITRYYDLTDAQNTEYKRLWEEYTEAQLEQGNEDSEDYRQLVEGMLVRQYLAKQMIPNTIELVDEKIEYGEKVVIIATFQEEMDAFKQYYKNKAVLFNGKMNSKKKDEAVEQFMNNPKIQVFIGQIEAMFGITLTSANYLVFNSYSWIAASNKQAEDRIYRLNQTRDVTCIYQVFNDDISKHMFETVQGKQFMADTIIKKENEK